MTLTLDSDIQTALCAWLKSPTLSGAPAFAWPGVTYKPVAGMPYLDVKGMLRSQPENPFYRFGETSTYRGIFQVDAVVPDGSGTQPGTDLAALVIERFTEGSQLVAGRYRLQVISPPWIATAVPDAPWIRFPVSIPYLVIA